MKTNFVCKTCTRINYIPTSAEMKNGKKWSKREWVNRKFCSQKCNLEYIKENGSPKRNGKNIECEQCNKSFYVAQWQISSGTKFCSYACKVKAQDNGISSENEKARKSTSYKLWRKSVFERDNYTCQSCGKVGGYLHADHIKPFAFFKQLRYEISNGRTLCVPCHKSTSTYGVKVLRLGVARES